MEKTHFYVLKKASAGWDEHEGFVIRATSERRAREIAHNASTSDEKSEQCWLDSSETTCRFVSQTGEEAIILKAFKPG